MPRLTAAEIAEPDVFLRIPIEKWANLPEPVTNLLRLFVVADHITVLVVRLPGYRWREVQQIAASCAAQDGQRG